MPVVFKYKNRASLSYAPGLATPGEDGDEGKQGVSGNTVYFTDYDLDNSYSIQLALQKIENNQMLSSSFSRSVPNRPYKENDILISKNMNVYKIVPATETSAQNYKFDIVHLGSMHDRHAPASIAKIVLYNITDKTINDTLYNSKIYSPLPTPRSDIFVFDEGGDVKNIDPSEREINGIWLKVFLLIEGGTDPELNEYFCEISKNLLENYSFNLEVRLKNKKSLQAQSGPVEMGDDENAILDPEPTELYQKFDFFKTLEFNNLCVIPTFDSDEFTDLVNREEEFASANNFKNKYSSDDRLINTFYLSDYSMDKMHPSGNNIKYTYSSTQSIWYKTGIGTPREKNLELNSDSSAYIYPYAYDDAIKYTLSEVEDVKYYYNTNSRPLNNSGAETSILNLQKFDASIFPTHAIGKSLTVDSSTAAQEELNTNFAETSLLQMSQRFLEDENSNVTLEKNLASGDSIYFSSIDDNKVKKSLYDFISDTENNKYILVIKNKKTNEITAVEAAVEFKTV